MSCWLKPVDVQVLNFQVNLYNALMSICVLNDLIWNLLRWKRLLKLLAETVLRGETMCLQSNALIPNPKFKIVFTSSFLHSYREVCGANELNWCTWSLKLIFHFCWRSVFIELLQNKTEWRFLMSDSVFMGRKGNLLDELALFWRSSFIFLKDPLREALSLPGSQTSLIRRVQ